jgi:hypothetical protein
VHRPSGKNLNSWSVQGIIHGTPVSHGLVVLETPAHPDVESSLPSTHVRVRIWSPVPQVAEQEVGWLHALHRGHVIEQSFDSCESPLQLNSTGSFGGAIQVRFRCCAPLKFSTWHEHEDHPVQCPHSAVSHAPGKGEQVELSTASSHSLAINFLQRFRVFVLVLSHWQSPSIHSSHGPHSSQVSAQFSTTVSVSQSTVVCPFSILHRFRLRDF